MGITLPMNVYHQELLSCIDDGEYILKRHRLVLLCLTKIGLIVACKHCTSMEREHIEDH